MALCGARLKRLGQDFLSLANRGIGGRCPPYPRVPYPHCESIIQFAQRNRSRAEPDLDPVGHTGYKVNCLGRYAVDLAQAVAEIVVVPILDNDNERLDNLGDCTKD